MTHDAASPASNPAAIPRKTLAMIRAPFLTSPAFTKRESPMHTWLRYNHRFRQRGFWPFSEYPIIEDR
jgi:hypothetical protein